MVNKIIHKLKYLFNKYIRIKIFSEYLPYIQNKFKRIKSQPPAKIDRIIVANIDSLGDSTWVTPLFSELKLNYPNSHITLICNRVCRDIFTDNPYIDQIQEIDPTDYYTLLKKNSSIPDFAKQCLQADLFIIAEMGARPADNLRLLAIKLKAKFILSSHLGILKNYTHLTSEKNTDIDPIWWPHYFLKMLSPLTRKEYSSEPLLEIYTTSEVERKIDKWLEDHNSKGNLILIHPMVAGYGLETKKWSNSNFIEVIKELHKNPMNIFLISGGPGEVEACDHLIREMQIESKRIISTARQFSIKELYTLLKRVNLTLSCDTSLFHFSNAAKAPTIGIFGATNSYKIAPQTLSHVKAFHSNLECWPCHKNRDFSPYWPKCIYSEAKCLIETTPKMVINYIQDHYPQLLKASHD